MIRRLIIAFIVLLGLGAGVLCGWTAWLARTLPTVAELRTWKPTRPLVPLPQIPPRLQQAFIATEDGDFYHEGALDYGAIARAAWVDVTHLGPVQGGSTITQQTARILFLNHDKTLSRKLKELIIAERLNRAWSKRHILDVYLNRIYLGPHAYGVRAAAHHYFHRSLKALNLPQLAMLAGLAANPCLLNPRRHPKAATRRRDHVLKRMLAMGFVGPTRVRHAEDTQMLASRDAQHASAAQTAAGDRRVALPSLPAAG